MTDKIKKRNDAVEPRFPNDDESWVPDFKQAVFFLAGVYAAECVRDAQTQEVHRGHALTGPEIAKEFREAAEYMTKQIQKTSGTGSEVKCPDCSRGYVHNKTGGPGDSSAWRRCKNCDGTGTVSR